MAMYIERVPNRNSPPAILLRESRREGKKVRKVTLANLSCLPEPVIALLRDGLAAHREGKPVALADVCEDVQVSNSTPFGHVAAVLGVMRDLGLPAMIGSRKMPCHNIILAMIAARVLDPRSKLATARQLDAGGPLGALNDQLGLGELDPDDLYDAMDRLVDRQPQIEAALAKKYLTDGSMVLVDVSGSYYEGRTCELAKFGHNRDGRKDRPQVIYALMCGSDGTPIAIEVFEGNTADPNTLAHQIAKLRDRFALDRIVLVGDRGLITSARIKEDLIPNHIDYISALRGPAVQSLVEQGHIQMSLFDQQDIAEITQHDDLDQGDGEEANRERLIACFNPLLAEERKRKREELLVLTERDLAKIKAAVERERRPLRGAKRIQERMDRVIDKRKMAKHFHVDITDHSFTFERNNERIESEAASDGFYVIRTNVTPDKLSPEGAVGRYKDLKYVERAFRCFKSIDLRVRPIHHRLNHRVKGHIFLCMLSYWVHREMRIRLSPLLYEDHDRAGAEARTASVVGPAMRSEAADTKRSRGQTDDGHVVRSFGELLAQLALFSQVGMEIAGQSIKMLTSPSPLVLRAFELLGVSLPRTQSTKA